MRSVKYFVDLFRALILRPLWRDPFRTGLTTLGVAIGVSVFLSIQLANHQTLLSFSQSLDLVLGKSDAVITAEGMPFDETHLKKLLPLRKWIKAYPVIEGYGVEESTGEVVEILGIDLLQDSGIRDFSMQTTANDLMGLLPLILDPKSIILPGKFIPGTQFQPGQSIYFNVHGRKRELHVNAVLENKGIARALNGNFALMDIAGAQLLFDKIGKLDRIDIEFKSGAKFEEMQKIIREVLPEFLRIDRPERKNRQVEKMLRAFQYNLSALSFVALLVGLYLIYNMISLSVVRRRMEIGALRAMGATPLLIATIFILEAGIIGTVGSALGIGLGYGLAQFSLEAVNVTVNNLYLPTQATEIDFHWNQMGPYFLLGVGLSLGSALIPAREAALTPPTIVMRRGSYDLKVFRGNKKLTRSGLIVLLLAGLSSMLPAIAGFPFFGFLSVSLLILGLSLFAPSALLATRDLTRSLCTRWFGGEGLLACRNLAQNVGRNAICVSSLAIAFMMVISMGIMVHSFRQTVEVWIGQTLKADLFVRAQPGKNIDYHYTLPVGQVEALRDTPGVKAVDLFRAINISYEDDPAILGSGDFNALSRYGLLIIKEGPPTQKLASLTVNKNRAIVSEAFSIKHDIQTGDIIPLQTPNGLLNLEVVAIYYDYSQERGYVIIDRTTFLKYFGDPNVNSFVVYLDNPAELTKVRAEIMRSIGTDHRILVRSNAELKSEVLNIFDKTFAITYSLEIIGAGVAMLGLFNTLISLIIERRREIGVLRFLGALKNQVKKMVMIEAGLLGLIGSVMGLVAGGIVSFLLIFVINKQSFGWTIQVFFPYGFLVGATLVFWLIAGLAGLYPARIAANLEPKQAVRVE